MIADSMPWKLSLLKDAKKLEMFRIDLDADAAHIAFEKLIFLTGFTIRKLLEAKKLTNRIANLDVKCHKIPLVHSENVPDFRNWLDLANFYDHENEQRTTVKMKFLVNQLIHSFIFGAIVQDEDVNKVEGFFIATDFDRSKFLYRYEIGEMIRIMGLVGNDHVVSSHMERNESGDWLIHNYGAEDANPKSSFGIE